MEITGNKNYPSEKKIRAYLRLRGVRDYEFSEDSESTESTRSWVRLGYKEFSKLTSEDIRFEGSISVKFDSEFNIDMIKFGTVGLGRLPESIGNLTNLRKLYLVDNELTRCPRALVTSHS